jgi:Xaa-Pro aminopeptidase
MVGKSRPFDPIVAAGANGSMPHAVPGDKTVSSGEFVNGLWLRQRRVLLRHDPDGSCGQCFRRDEDKSTERCFAAQRAGIAAAAAGVRGSEVDNSCESGYRKKRAYGRYFGHGFGHGLGIEVHEPPTASPPIRLRFGR